MKKIITNDYNLNESDVTEVVKRVKILFVNSNNEILLGYSYNTFQFPGGHVEDNEDLWSTVIRELKEETGIEGNFDEVEPFVEAIGYYKDWPEKGKNRKIEIYYYEINSDIKPNLDNTNYTSDELEGNFELRYIPLKNVEEVLIENSNKYGDKKGISKEMLKVLKYYKNEK